MSENANEKICKICKKALIDETIPICLRCRLTGKKNAIGVGKWVGGLGAGALALLKVYGDAQSNTDDSIDTNYYDDNEDT